MSQLFYQSTEDQVDYTTLINVLNNRSHFYEDYCADSYPDFFFNTILGLLTDQSFVLRDFIHEKRPNINPIHVKTYIEDMDDLIHRIRCSRSEIGIYSSGSEGPPKLVFQPVSRLLESVRISPEYRHTKWGFTYHPAHSAGIQFLLQVICNGGAIINLRDSTPGNLKHLMQTSEPDFLAGTPTFYRLLSPYDFQIKSVKTITLNGEKSTQKLIDDLKMAFPNAKIRNIYGSTEAGPLMSSESEVFTVPERLSGKLKIDEQCQLLFHNSIVSSSVGSMEWYPSGDLVQVINQEPLQIRFISRISRIINVGGHMVNPQEIEELILHMPGIQDVRVYGRENPVTGHLITAEIVPDLSNSITEKQVIDFLKSRSTAAYKIPRIIRFVPSILQGRTGKKQI